MISNAQVDKQNVIDQILTNPKPIENLMTYWIKSPRYVLTFGPESFQEKPSKKEVTGDFENMRGNLVLLVEGNKPVGGVSFDVKRLKKAYRKVDSWFQPVVLADSGERRLPYEEVEEHRLKNGTKWDEEAEIFMINSSFLGNLCVSYLIDNRASIKITQTILEDYKYRVRDYFIIEIFHLGKIPGLEKYAIMKERVSKYVEKS
jgi:hypothetical protein